MPIIEQPLQAQQQIPESTSVAGSGPDEITANVVDTNEVITESGVRIDNIFETKQLTELIEPPEIVIVDIHIKKT